MPYYRLQGDAFSQVVSLAERFLPTGPMPLGKLFEYGLGAKLARKSAQIAQLQETIRRSPTLQEALPEEYAPQGPPEGFEEQVMSELEEPVPEDLIEEGEDASTEF